MYGNRVRLPTCSATTIELTPADCACIFVRCSLAWLDEQQAGWKQEKAPGAGGDGAPLRHVSFRWMVHCCLLLWFTRRRGVLDWVFEQPSLRVSLSVVAGVCMIPHDATPTRSLVHQGGRNPEAYLLYVFIWSPPEISCLSCSPFSRHKGTSGAASRLLVWVRFLPCSGGSVAREPEILRRPISSLQFVLSVGPPLTKNDSTAVSRLGCALRGHGGERIQR